MLQIQTDRPTKAFIIKNVTFIIIWIWIEEYESEEVATDLLNTFLCHSKTWAEEKKNDTGVNKGHKCQNSFNLCQQLFRIRKSQGFSFYIATINIAHRACDTILSCCEIMTFLWSILIGVINYKSLCFISVRR